MELQETIKNEIKEYLEDRVINTTLLRTSKVHGVAGATIYNIIHYNYIPGKGTLIKLLKGFGYTYKLGFNGFTNVQKKKKEDEKEGVQ